MMRKIYRIYFWLTSADVSCRITSHLQTTLNKDPAHRRFHVLFPTIEITVPEWLIERLTPCSRSNCTKPGCTGCSTGCPSKKVLITVKHVSTHHTPLTIITSATTLHQTNIIIYIMNHPTNFKILTTSILNWSCSKSNNSDEQQEDVSNVYPPLDYDYRPFKI